MSVSDTTLLRAPRAGLARPLVRVLGLLRRIDLPLVAIVAIAFLWVEHYMSRVTHWGVMTDELQYARLATSVFEDHTIVPHLHGEYVHIYSQLYPLLLAPVYQLFDMATAYKVAHALNAFVMASTAIPACLLAREVTGRRVASYAVGALSVTVPWMMLSGLIYTEVLAYPVFTWTAWALFRAVAAPSPRRDALAIAWLVAAFFTRTQFVVVWAAFPLVVLLHELGYRGPGVPAGGLRERLVLVWREHRILTVFYALVALVVVVARFRGGVSQLLGSYAITTSGNLFPAGMGAFMRTHVLWVAVGIGIVQLVLAVAWAFSVLFRPPDRRAHAYALLMVTTVLLMTVQVSSFTLRFTGGPSIEDRYLFFVIPLVLVGALAFLVERRPRTIALLATGAVTAYLLGITDFTPTKTQFFASPEALFHLVLTGRAWEVGHHLGIDNLTAATALRWGTVILAVGLAVALRYAPRRIVMAVVGAGLLAWGVAETTWTFKHTILPLPTANAPFALAGDVANKRWVDHALPSGARAAMVPAPQYAHDQSPIWWELEMWNKKVSRAISFHGDSIFTPFPASGLELKLSTGRLIGPQPTRYLIFDSADTRFRPEGVRPESLVHWGTYASELIEPRRPWRADWATVGFGSDGWGIAGNHTRAVRVYGYGNPKGRTVGLTLTTQGPPGPARRFVVSAQGRRYTGLLTPDKLVQLAVPVCVRWGQRFVDVKVTTAGSFKLPQPDPRRVTLHLDRVDVEPAAPACAKPGPA